MFRNTTLAAGCLVALTACTQPTPEPIYAEPEFNKLGQPSCRPGDVPVDAFYTADLPICPIIAPAQAARTPSTGSDGDQATSATGTTDTTGGTGDDPTTGGPSNQNQNNNQNTNQENNRNRNG